MELDLCCRISIFPLTRSRLLSFHNSGLTSIRNIGWDCNVESACAIYHFSITDLHKSQQTEWLAYQETVQRLGVFAALWRHLRCQTSAMSRLDAQFDVLTETSPYLQNNKQLESNQQKPCMAFKTPQVEWTMKSAYEDANAAQSN